MECRKVHGGDAQRDRGKERFDDDFFALHLRRDHDEFCLKVVEDPGELFRVKGFLRQGRQRRRGVSSFPIGYEPDGPMSHLGVGAEEGGQCYGLRVDAQKQRSRGARADDERVEKKAPRKDVCTCGKRDEEEIPARLNGKEGEEVKDHDGKHRIGRHHPQKAVEEDALVAGKTQFIEPERGKEHDPEEENDGKRGDMRPDVRFNEAAGIADEQDRGERRVEKQQVARDEEDEFFANATVRHGRRGHGYAVA